MAKPLHEPPPSSSVARLLDRHTAARATVVPSSTLPHVTEPASGSTDAPAPIKREFTLSPSTDEAFNRLVAVYRRATKTRLSNSHVIRAIFIGLTHCMDSLEHEALRCLVPQKLPSNARGSESDRARFEQRLAYAFIAGMRAAPAYRQTDRDDPKPDED